MELIDNKCLSWGYIFLCLIMSGLKDKQRDRIYETEETHQNAEIKDNVIPTYGKKINDETVKFIN